MIFAEWQVGQVLWSMLWFTLFFLWIWVVIMVFSDIFRSHDLSGFSKALWILFVIFLPVLGVLAYLIARGDKITEHRVRDAQQADQAMQSYIRSTVATPATDLSALADLRDRGVIDEAEFESMKQRLVTS
jgi:Phospholipase_D-nuclease N-terminal/Short C-terminal domain